jgi:hypothetical protein
MTNESKPTVYLSLLLFSVLSFHHWDKEMGEVQNLLNQNLSLKFLKAVDFTSRFIFSIIITNLPWDKLSFCGEFLGDFYTDISTARFNLNDCEKKSTYKFWYTKNLLVLNRNRQSVIWRFTIKEPHNSQRIWVSLRYSSVLQFTVYIKSC